MWDLIVSVSDHCLSFYFTDSQLENHFGVSSIFVVGQKKKSWQNWKKKYIRCVLYRKIKYFNYWS